MRYELKYLISPRQYQKLNTIMQVMGTPDPHSKSDFYPIMSIYYDDIDKNATYDKINGEYFHTRIRMRKYSTQLNDPEQPFFLELKFKSNTRSEKTRIQLPSDVKWANPNWWKEIKDPKINIFLSYMNRHPLIRSTIVFYQRRAYELPAGIRLNFDQCLLHLDPHETEVKTDHFYLNTQLPLTQRILEIKSPSPALPQYLTNLLNRNQIEPHRFSKFAGAMQHQSESYRESGIVV